MAESAKQWMVAETLAGHLLPLLEHYDVKWRGHGVIYVNHEYYNIDTAQRILADLSQTLGVPAHLIRSRLIDLGLLNDVRTAVVRNDALRIIGKQAFKRAAAPKLGDPEINEDEHGQD